MKFPKFWNRNPTRKNTPKASDVNSMAFISQVDSGFYYNGQMYESDIIRACIRPQVKAIGKLVGKHIKETSEGLTVNQKAYLKFLLLEPNVFMTNQVMFEKVMTQLELNSNAFIYIQRDTNGLPCALYPVNCVHVLAEFDNTNNLYLRFTLKNGSRVTYNYQDIIHLRQDFNGHDIFGDSPINVLKPLMKVATTTDQGIIKAIKNSNVINWILNFKQGLRDEDIREATEKFASNYLDGETGVGGAVATDVKFDAKQIEYKGYVPNAALIDRNTTRLYNFYNTNEKIIQNKATEDEWNTFYEGKLEPIVKQLSEEYTRKILNRAVRHQGEYILWEADNLQYASMKTKLGLVAMVDRGGLNNNEWRRYMNMGRIEGGEEYIRRLDTAVVKGGENK